MARWRAMFALLFALIVLAAALPVAAADAPAPEGNVRVTLYVGRTGVPGGNTERTYRMLGAPGGRTEMLVGWRMPIPTQRAMGGESGDTPVMSYVYQNIGVSTQLDIGVPSGGKVVLDGRIEVSGQRDSTLVDASGAKVPMIGTFQQSLRVVAQEGRRLRVAEGPDPETGTVYVDIEVDVLD